VTDKGRAFFVTFGIDAESPAPSRRPLCRPCLDWSVRRDHLAGALGAALLDKCYERGWARRLAGTRVVQFTRAGERAFRECFGPA
jgi:hypothetical protein